MEKREVGPRGKEGPEEESGKEAILHYEEHITGLLVTIAHLQGKIEKGKIERLQQNKARGEEDYSDLGTGSGFPRCLPLFASRTRSPSPPPPAGPEEGKADLFLEVHWAITSLENVVLSYRDCLPSVEAELEGHAQGAEGLEARLVKLQLEAQEPPCERKIALFKERNAALRAELGAKEEALSRSTASLLAYQQERSKLQRKVKELQDSLSQVEISSGGAPRLLGQGEHGGGGAQDPSGAARKGLRPPWGATSTQPACALPCPTPAETQNGLEQLHRSVERLRRVNRLLSGALQESKTDAERISLLLGCQESDHTALVLAARCSECCLEAYETLLALTAMEQEPNPETGRDGPWAGTSKSANPALEKAYRFLQACSATHSSSWEQDGARESSTELLGSEEEAKRRLWECIGCLRAEQRSLKLPTHQPSPGLGSVAARLNADIGAKVAEGQRAVQEELPGPATQPKMQKAQLLQQLHAAREALADLGTRLHLTAKERQALQLQTTTLWAQEAAYLLLVQTLQQEHRALQGQLPPSSGSSSSEGSTGACTPEGVPKRPPPAACKDAGRNLVQMEPEALMLQFLETSARIRTLKDRLEALLEALEERSQDCRAHEAQEMELLQDFFQAHSTLLLAYQKARRKQESQVGQLESQMGLMTGRQAKQRQALMRTLRQLQDRASTGTPAGLPRALASGVRTLDLPGSLEATTRFSEEKVRLPGHAQTRLQASQGSLPAEEPPALPGRPGKKPTS